MQLLLNAFYSENKPYEMCKGCPRFGCVWSCPPYNFDVKLITSLYETANLLVLKVNPISDEDRVNALSAEKINHTLKGFRTLLDPILISIEKRIPDSRVLFAGSCFLCGENPCTRLKGMPCKNPQTMRYSLESLGLNVKLITEVLFNIKLDWATPDAPCRYLCLVYALLSKDEIDLSAACTNLNGEMQL